MLCASLVDALAQGGPLLSSRWTLGSEDSMRSWSSGKSKDLSEWKIVSCPSKYGDRFLLTGLTGFKEPWSNLDNFIAGLKATCTEFERKSQHTDAVFTSKGRRDTAYELDAFDWKRHGDLLCPAHYNAVRWQATPA